MSQNYNPPNLTIRGQKVKDNSREMMMVEKSKERGLTKVRRDAISNTIKTTKILNKKKAKGSLTN